MLSQYSLFHIHALARPRCTNTIKREQNKAKVSFFIQAYRGKTIERDVNMKETREKFTTRCDIFEKNAILNILFCRKMLK